VGLSEGRRARLQPTRKVTDDAFIESFNGKLRAECLNAHWFLSLDDARATLRRIEARRQLTVSTSPVRFFRTWAPEPRYLRKRLVRVH
jgi:transposase InsO family protein